MLAAIDIGSNTVRMLIATITPDGTLTPIRQERRMTRLAGGLSDRHSLREEAMARTLVALRDFRDICSQHQVEQLQAVGTAAFRQARNGAFFGKQIFAAIRIPVRILSGEEEARLSAKGVALALEEPARNLLIFDIGGGSTEFVHLVEGSVRWADSLPLGVVRLCEAFHQPEEAEPFIRQTLGPVYEQVAGCESAHPLLVGTAGTVTSLAAMDLEMVDYDWRRINNYSLRQSRLRSLAQRLRKLSPSQREALPGLEAGRGDLIMPGIQIVLALLDLFGRDCLKVSDFGILEGLILQLAQDSSSVRRN